MSLSADIIANLTHNYLSERYDSPHPIPAFHMELWNLCCSEKRYVAIASPRGSAKSTAITHAYVLANVLFRESSFVIIASETEGQAIDFLADIRMEIHENHELRSLFKILKVIKDSQTSLVVKFRDGDMFRIDAKGSEQKLRGIKWRGKRPDLFIGDDLEGDEQVMNKERREKFSKWIYGAVLPMLSETGKARFVGTILHQASFLEQHMPDRKSSHFIHGPLFDKEDSPDSLWSSIRYRAHSPDFKYMLWADSAKLSIKALQAAKADYVRRGFPEVYSQEYLNIPIDDSAAYFKNDDFLKAPDKLPKLKYYAAIDFAITQKERSDYTVIAIVGIDDAGFMYVVDIRRGRWDALEIIEEMFSVQKKYEPEIFTAETGMIEKTLGPFLKAEMLKSHRGFINLNPMNPTKDKRQRASALQARMRAKSVYFDHDAHWFMDLKTEMVRFPRDEHDDQVDALAWIGLTLDQIIQPLTAKEEEEEYYANMQSQERFGRSMVTGY